MKNRYLKLILTVFFVIITSITSVWAFSFRNMTLDFIQISDTHISMDKDDTSYKTLSSSSLLLKDAIEQINNIKGLDFVLFTGDLVNDATYENYEQYYKLLTKLKYPSLNAFGNHDFYGMEKDEVLNLVKQYNPNYIFDKTYYAFSPKTDYRIIVLDSTKQNITTANGELSDEQLKFLDNELNQNKDKVILIALHHPSVQPFVSNDHELINASQFNEILLKYKNPIIVVSGHYHAAKIRVMGNLTFVSTPAMVTYPMAFRHIKITNFKDRVKYEFAAIPTRLDEIQEKNRQSVISYSILQGNEKDRNYTYTFLKKHPKSTRYKKNKIQKASIQTKTTQRDIKKLSKPLKNKEDKKLEKLEKKNQKIELKKEKKEKNKKEKVKVEKPKKEKTPKEKSGFGVKMKNFFRNLFHKNKNVTTQQEL